MKKKLVVIDFDKTLIDYDSFRLFTLKWSRKQPVVAVFIAMRLLRIIDAGTFKRRVVLTAQRSKKLSDFLTGFVDFICSGINPKVMEKALKDLDSQTEILILSASPHLYMESVGKKLNIKSQGSYFDPNNEFIHLHGREKLKFLQKYYPGNQYEYSYAVSDCQSDLPLLQQFKTFDLIRKNE